MLFATAFGGRFYGKSKAKHKRAPKSILKLPDLEQSQSAVLNSLTSPSSQRTYDHAIREFIEWYCSEPGSLSTRLWSPDTTFPGAAALRINHINLRLAAIRRLAYEAADCGLLSADLAAGIRRVRGQGVWGACWQLAHCETGQAPVVDSGQRKPSTQARLCHTGNFAGVRPTREELAALRVEDIQQREEHWVIADLVGKGRHIRTIPVLIG